MAGLARLTNEQNLHMEKQIISDNSKLNITGGGFLWIFYLN